MLRTTFSNISHYKQWVPLPEELHHHHTPSDSSQPAAAPTLRLGGEGENSPKTNPKKEGFGGVKHLSEAGCSDTPAPQGSDRIPGHWLLRTSQLLQQSKASSNKNTVVWWIFGCFPEFLLSHNHFLSSTNSLGVHQESELTMTCLGRNPSQSLPSQRDDQLKQLLLKKSQCPTHIP